MKDQLVSFLTAKLAKEKGFNISCRSHYTVLKTKTVFKTNYVYRANSKKENIILVPTQTTLARWLRETHNVDVQPYLLIVKRALGNTFLPQPIIKSKKYNCIIYKDGIIVEKSKEYCRNDYEDALEIGLQEALKKQIKL